MKHLALAAALALFVAPAMADEPVELSDQQMATVTAGFGFGGFTFAPPTWTPTDSSGTTVTFDFGEIGSNPESLGFGSFSGFRR